MPLKLVFIGRLEDIAGASEMEFSVDQVDDILAALEPDLAEALTGPRIRLALNGTLVNDRASLVLNDGDELAFLPPVSGG
jgi:molybdopterin synthase sulfur carrier subunit